MKVLPFILLLILAMLASGCVERLSSLGQTTKVVYVNVTLEERNYSDEKVVTLNRTNPNVVVVTGIEARGGEMPGIWQERLAEKFPAIYIHLLQRQYINYVVGLDYIGPGRYNFTVGLREGNTSIPMVILVETFNETGDSMGIWKMGFNWSDEILSKTFK